MVLTHPSVDEYPHREGQAEERELQGQGKAVDHTDHGDPHTPVGKEDGEDGTPIIVLAEHAGHALERVTIVLPVVEHTGDG